uniref:Odorant binding protein 19c n=1 Tax=Drosophila melanogaster TaxID=7227 RepID=E2DBU7_DROME|nr:odorant binding protein 19c [Drosophila melanogaster]ACY93572.1 odorant binding protein 19c [Drosophila melanogaster]ACY93573.1 odorant binding protein 19c [Drosophila melanogaster]ACY93591.1 odorant binding protein 19c [Drosophila melanogaster]ACY93605.1 odorant binding protein 19c [Drosophila melanogaster]
MKPSTPVAAIPLMTIVVAVLLQTHCVRGQTQAFDLAKLLPKTGTEPIWAVIDRNLPQVQELVTAARMECIQKLQLPRDQRPLVKVTNPSEKEKCLVECVLKKIKLMDADNKLNVGQVEKLTSLVTQDNKMAIAVSSSMAQACSRGISSKNPCEVAHLFNQCISRQLERNNVKLVW